MTNNGQYWEPATLSVGGGYPEDIISYPPQNLTLEIGQMSVDFTMSVRYQPKTYQMNYWFFYKRTLTKLCSIISMQIDKIYRIILFFI